MKTILASAAAAIVMSAGAAFADPLQAGTQPNQVDRPELRGHHADGMVNEVAPFSIPFFGLDMGSTASIDDSDPNVVDEVDPGTIDAPVY